MASISQITDFIDSYGGIFKSVTLTEAQPVFRAARQNIADEDFDSARGRLTELKQICKDNADDLTVVDAVLSEIERYLATRIPEGVKPAEKIVWSDVTSRRLQTLEEATSGLPQGLFFLRNGRPGTSSVPLLIGRKILSDYWLNGKIYEIFCSLITPSMLLGVHYGQRVTEDSYLVTYYPLTNSEKLRVLDDVKNDVTGDVELTFPFPLLKRATRREYNSSPDGWKVDNALDALLSNGEERMRAYTIKLLQKLGLTKGRFYDPACSTGIFLSTLQAAFPDIYTIGQDLSSQMTDIAKERVDEAHCGNALHPKIEPQSTDIVFARFLNSEVVNYKEAVAILPSLLSTVKAGGYLVILGLTPVLVSTADFAAYPDFVVVQCVGPSVDGVGVFQYYLLRRKSACSL